MERLTKTVVSEVRKRLARASSNCKRAGTWLDTDKQLSVLLDIGLVREQLTGAERLLVAHARERGATWAEIAAFTGISRQAAHEKWGQLRYDGMTVVEEPKLL